MTMQIEFKIKTQLGTKWEDLSPVWYCENKSQIEGIVKSLKELYKFFEIPGTTSEDTKVTISLVINQDVFNQRTWPTMTTKI